MPRLYLTWITPSHFEPGDAELDVLSLLLAGGKNSRLYKRLVYELQIAQDVAAFQASKTLNSGYQIVVTAGPRVDDRFAPSSTKDREDSTGAAHRSGVHAGDQPDRGVLLRPNGRVGDFGGVGDQMNGTISRPATPAFQRGPLTLSRASPADIQATAARFLP